MFEVLRLQSTHLSTLLTISKEYLNNYSLIHESLSFLSLIFQGIGHGLHDDIETNEISELAT